jgi:2'-5' RNA ligase
MSLYRTFIALKVSSTPELEEVLDWLGRLGPGVRPVRPDVLHLTLKFLGDIASGQVEEIAGSLRKTASAWAPFELVFRGIGLMPTRRPRVIFADLADPDHHVPLVAGPVADIEEAMAGLGFDAESRPFRPHLTLARIRSHPGAELDEIRQAYEEVILAEVRCEHVELIRSELAPGGARYTTLATLPLSG